VLNVLDQLDCFSKSDIDFLSKDLKNKNLSIGIKSLLDVVELSKQTTDAYRCARFVNALEEIGGLHD